MTKVDQAEARGYQRALDDIDATLKAHLAHGHTLGGSRSLSRVVIASIRQEGTVRYSVTTTDGWMRERGNSPALALLDSPVPNVSAEDIPQGDDTLRRVMHQDGSIVW